MAEESFQERTEKATPKRREKSREKGQVAKSQDLNAAAIIVLGFTALFLLGPQLVGNILQMMRYTMANAATIASFDVTFYKVFTDNIENFMSTMMPMFMVMVVVGAGINIAQVGFKITPKAIEPKFEKVNVISGLKKLFSMRSAVQLVRDPLKLVIVGLVGFLAIRSEFEDFFLLPDLSVAQLGTRLSILVLTIALKIGGAILVIAILDYMYQRYEHEKSIKMTKQDVRDEYKDSEGSPQTKSRVRQIQREMSRKRMMTEIPTADVVVTNPTHIAVALKYDPNEMDAPTVIAKGQRLIAQKIKEIARKHGIPIIEDKPLARSLFKMCEIGQIVPANLYRAVAEILAHIYRLKGKAVR
ncbi:MAG: flagellar biosynthesis protein FlhB [Candidatus Zixiibacteriota bacterium]|nr:MAG: flagellar biosynthesis protein FlhB [candidate division Zixibacteria bacterium]